MASDLHARLLAEIERREAVAHAATQALNGIGSWGALADLTHVAVRALTHEGDGWTVADEVMDGRTAEHIALHDPADALRRYTHARKILAKVDKLRANAIAKDASADRMGDPKDPDMSGSDRIAWLLQRDAAEAMRELADALELDLADSLGVPHTTTQEDQ